MSTENPTKCPKCGANQGHAMLCEAQTKEEWEQQARRYHALWLEQVSTTNGSALIWIRVGSLLNWFWGNLCSCKYSYGRTFGGLVALIGSIQINHPLSISLGDENRHATERFSVTTQDSATISNPFWSPGKPTVAPVISLSKVRGVALLRATQFWKFVAITVPGITSESSPIHSKAIENDLPSNLVPRALMCSSLLESSKQRSDTKLPPFPTMLNVLNEFGNDSTLSKLVPRISKVTMAEIDAIGWLSGFSFSPSSKFSLRSSAVFSCSSATSLNEKKSAISSIVTPIATIKTKTFSKECFLSGLKILNRNDLRTANLINGLHNLEITRSDFVIQPSLRCEGECFSLSTKQSSPIHPTETNKEPNNSTEPQKPSEAQIRRIVLWIKLIFLGGSTLLLLFTIFVALFLPPQRRRE